MDDDRVSLHRLQAISFRSNISIVIIDWPESFGHFWDRLEVGAEKGDAKARAELDFLLAELAVLADLKREPDDESATLKRVRQSRRFPVWRVAHPFHPRVAMRLIVWFPPKLDDLVVVALFAGNKAQMGDVFYDSVGLRADGAIEQWIRQQQHEQEEGER
jgi:hypothetical protein